MKKSGKQKMNPYLSAALRAEKEVMLIERIPREEDPPHPQGITEEHYSDGSKRFTGTGGGVLWILADGSALVMPPEEPPPLRVRLLMEVAVKHMPASPLEIGDVEKFKGEALVLLEALRMGEPQFFRDIANAIQPPPSVVKSRAISAEKNSQCDEVLQSIADAAGGVHTKPAFHAILKKYQTWAGKDAEEAKEFRKKLIQRGFGWLR